MLFSNLAHGWWFASSCTRQQTVDKRNGFRTFSVHLGCNIKPGTKEDLSIFVLIDDNSKKLPYYFPKTFEGLGNCRAITVEILQQTG